MPTAFWQALGLMVLVLNVTVIMSPYAVIVLGVLFGGKEAQQVFAGWSVEKKRKVMLGFFQQLIVFLLAAHAVGFM